MCARATSGRVCPPSLLRGVAEEQETEEEEREEERKKEGGGGAPDGFLEIAKTTAAVLRHCHSVKPSFAHLVGITDGRMRGSDAALSATEKSIGRQLRALSLETAWLRTGELLPRCPVS